MASDFQSVLNLRNFVSIGTSKGIQIIGRRNKIFNELLKDALDQLYKERLLEDGRCTVCLLKTSKWCSGCGIHYCSIACQSQDWPNHRSTCKSSQSKYQKNMNEKPKNSDTKHTNDPTNNHGNFNLSRPHTGGNSKPTSRYSSYQDVSIAGRSTEDEESSRESIKENSRNPQHFKRNFKPKYIRRRENDQKNSGKERRGGFKKFSPLQKLQVKRMTVSKGQYWVIQKCDIEKFHKIQETLDSEWRTYPASNKLPNGLFGMRFNNVWYRCKVVVQEPKLLIRCVDTGNVFCPKHISVVELPQNLKEDGNLAFRVVFKDSTPPGEEVEWLNIRILGILPNGSYEIKLCDDIKAVKNVGVEEVMKKDKVEEEVIKDKVEEVVIKDEVGRSVDRKKKRTQKKKKKQQEEMTKKSPPNAQSVIDELKVSTKGIFLPSLITKDSILGCLAPDDVNKAMYCYNSIGELYLADGHIIEGFVGDCVMVAGEDTTGHRGIILSKNENSYKVRLIDYGYEVETEKVYKLPEKMADMMHLACSVTLLDCPPRRCDEFEVKRGYDMEVIKKAQNGDWVCKFATYPDLDQVFATGTVSKPWKCRRRVNNYVPFENNDMVLITGVGLENAVHIKHIPGGKWDDMLDNLNLKLNTGEEEPHLSFQDVNIGDIILSKYNYDGLWYRAEVVQKKTDKTVRVVFVDYGNFQYSCESELRKLPEGIKEPFFTMRVRLSGPGTTFTPEGREYLTSFKDDSAYVRLLLTDNDLSKGVVLIDEDGVELNKIAFAAESELDSYSSDVAFDKEQFLKPEGFQLGIMKEFVCLHVGRDTFFKTGVFWGFNAGIIDFTNFVKMSDEMRDACESKPSEYSPEVGDLCIVQHQGDWYRGHIVNKFGHFFDVIFVDRGNSQLIESWNVRKMELDFFKFPAVAAKCFISDFSNLKDKEILNIYGFLSKNVNTVINNKAVVVKVIGDEHYFEFRDI